MERVLALRFPDPVISLSFNHIFQRLLRVSMVVSGEGRAGVQDLLLLPTWRRQVW
jgi:hypothetical protein